MINYDVFQRIQTERRYMMKKLMMTLPALVMALFVFINAASAHVKISPDQAEKGSYQTFTVNVPSEKENTATTQLKVDIPIGVTVSRVEVMPNWKYELKKDKTGKITSITWESTGDGLSPTEFAQFKMSGKVDDNAADALTFKAYQTYKDGSVVKWVGQEGSDTPAPMVKISAASAMSADHKTMTDNSQAGDMDSSSSNVPLYLSIVGIILAIIAIIMATVNGKRKKS